MYKENPMSIISTPHDLYFKSAMSDLRVAKDFFQNHLPHKILEIVDLNSLKRCNESFVDEDLSNLITDMLFSTNFLGEQGYLYLLLEHKSWVERMLPFYVLRCQCRIMNYHVKSLKARNLPIIVPLLFYNGDEKYNLSTDIYDLFENSELARKFMFKPVQLIDVSQIPDEELKRHQWSYIMEFIMKHVRSRNFMKSLELMLPTMRTIAKRGEKEYIIKSINYMMNVRDIEDYHSLKNMIRKFISEEMEDEIMTIAERLKLEGEMKGELKGELKGKQKGIKIVAKQMLNEGADFDFISRVTKLTHAEILNLQNEEIM